MVLGILFFWLSVGWAADVREVSLPAGAQSWAFESFGSKGPLLQDQEVVLTFDDGPWPQTTPLILQTLKEHGVRAHFFDLGFAAQKWPEWVRAEIADGHVVGSHSWSHPDFNTLLPAQAHSQIEEGHKAVVLAGGAGVEPFFRFPFGAYTVPAGARREGVIRAAVDQGLHVFAWNVPSKDWEMSDPAAIVRQVLTQLEAQSRGVVLMHDTHMHTVKALRVLLPELKARGFRFVVFKR